MAMMSDLSHTQNRRPLATLGKVAIGVLVGIALILAYTMIVVDGQPDVALFIFIAMTLAALHSLPQDGDGRHSWRP